MNYNRFHFVSLLATLTLLVSSVQATIVNATWNSPTDVPVTAGSYSATGNTVNFTLNFAPAVGTELMVVNNTGLSFINGSFSNLAQGQAVPLSFGGATYHFVANYYGGTGNDLVLVWAATRTYAWGYNLYGELGNGTLTNYTLPVAVSMGGLLSNKTVVALAADGAHSLALCSDGSVAAWGQNANGELGNGTTTDTNVPVAVSTSSALSNKTVVAIAAGLAHSLALCSDGTLVAWGDDGNGELGDNWPAWPYGSTIPVAVYTNSVLSNKTVVAIAAGAYFSLALCSDGSVASWGYNGVGELGDGTSFVAPDYGDPIPQAVSTNSVLSNKTVIAIAAGEYHSLALCSDGTVIGWGENREGELGDGTATIRTLPVAVSTLGALSNKTVVSIAAGSLHSLALCSDGTVVAWGYNAVGQLGNGTIGNTNVPVAVSTVGVLSNKTVVAIAAGSEYSLALCSDGTLAAWGDNEFDELGNPITGSTSLPVAVVSSSLPAGARFTHLYSGESALHTLALVALSTTPNVTSVALGGGMATSKFTGFPGFNYNVEASTNLSDWLVIGSQTAGTNGLFQFTDPTAASYRSRFYRAKSQ